MKPIPGILLFIALSASSASAEELGRLFFTPQQRAQLEQRKQQATASTANAHVLRVDGIVQKHGGPRTVWINGVPREMDNEKTNAPASLSLSVPGQSHPVKVKVGQKLLLPPEQP